MENKKSGKKQRKSTMNFPASSKFIEKLTDSEKHSKRKGSQAISEYPITNIDNNKYIY